MHNIFNLNPKISTALAVLIGYALIDDLNAYEQNTLGNWLMLISQLLITNATSQQMVEYNFNKENNTLNINAREVKNIYSPLIYDIETLKKIIGEINPENREEIFKDIHMRLSKIEKIISNIEKSQN